MSLPRRNVNGRAWKDTTKTTHGMADACVNC